MYCVTPDTRVRTLPAQRRAHCICATKEAALHCPLLHTTRWLLPPTSRDSFACLSSSGHRFRASASRSASPHHPQPAISSIEAPNCLVHSLRPWFRTVLVCPSDIRPIDSRFIDGPPLLVVGTTSNYTHKGVPSQRNGSPTSVCRPLSCSLVRERCPVVQLKL